MRKFFLDRYVRGRKMAMGAEVRAENLEEAKVKAHKLTYGNDFIVELIQAYEAAKGDGWRPISELEEGELVYVEGVSKCCGCEGDELCALAYRDKDGDVVTQSQDILDWHDMKFYPLPTSPKSEV